MHSQIRIYLLIRLLQPLVSLQLTDSSVRYPIGRSIKSQAKTPILFHLTVGFDRYQPRPLGRGLDALVGRRFLLPVFYQHDETIDPNSKHNDVLINSILWNLD